MNTTENLRQMENLKMKGMAKSYEAILGQPVHQQPEGHELVGTLLQAETMNRQHQTTQMLLNISKLRYQAGIEQIICSPARNLSKQQLAGLSDCSFIDRAENILVNAPTGGGKSYLICALGQQTCMLGYKTLYLNMNRFIERVSLSKVDGTFIKLLNYMEKIKLLIFDDFGLQPLDHNTKLALLQILEDRYQRKSVIIASQLPISKWHQYIDEPTLADAILDRLSANAHRIELKGESLRKKKI
jgi:DNA replication protein DnaC